MGKASNFGIRACHAWGVALPHHHWTSLGHCPLLHMVLPIWVAVAVICGLGAQERPAFVNAPQDLQEGLSYETPMGYHGQRPMCLAAHLVFFPPLFSAVMAICFAFQCPSSSWLCRVHSTPCAFSTPLKWPFLSFGHNLSNLQDEAFLWYAAAHPLPRPLFQLMGSSTPPYQSMNRTFNIDPSLCVVGSGGQITQAGVRGIALRCTFIAPDSHSSLSSMPSQP